jgi:serine/threonine-protein kinase
MEFLPGETLSARFKREGCIAPPEALAIAVQLCQALTAAHLAGVLHRDFKPGNVMLTGSGENIRAIVTDFGIARWIGTAADSPATLTTQGAVFGTPAYMSPEQIEGKELTVASDIYSLGLVLYEMVTGVRPFYNQSSWTEAIRRLTTDPPEPRKVVAAVDETWSRVILRCLERDPSRRYASVQDVSATLQGKEQTGPFLIARQRFMCRVAAIVILLAGAGVVFRDRIFQPGLPAEKHVAVLPFKFVDADSRSQATAYSLAESLTENLARLQPPGSSTWVVPWRAIRERPANDESHAGASLGANLLLTAQMERRDGRFRVAAELKNANTLKRLRAGVIDVPEADAVTVQQKLIELAVSMLQLKVPEGSLQRLQVAETPMPGAYEFYEEGRGYLLRRTSEDTDRAIVMLRQAIERDPGFALAHANLAIAYEFKYHDTKELSWIAKAKDSCAKAMQLNDKLSPAYMASGMILLDTGDLDSAIQTLRKAIAIDPANDEARNALAVDYEQAGRLLDAETLLKDAINHNPANWANYNDLAVFYYRHQQYNLAEPLFRSAIELAPGSPRAFYNLGGLYAVQGKNKEAEDILRRAIAIRPTSGAYSNLGTVLLAEGRYADSASMLEKAVELVPGDERLWSNLGNAYVMAGDKAKADRAYQGSVQAVQKKLALRPQDQTLLEELALSYGNVHDRKNALLTLARITGPSAHRPETLLNHAMVYTLIGEWDRALAMLEAALQAGASVDQIRNNLAFDDLRGDARYARIVDAGRPTKVP